jgi:virginiamycin B lyase
MSAHSPQKQEFALLALLVRLGNWASLVAFVLLLGVLSVDAFLLGWLGLRARPSFVLTLTAHGGPSVALLLTTFASFINYYSTWQVLRQRERFKVSDEFKSQLAPFLQRFLPKWPRGGAATGQGEQRAPSLVGSAAGRSALLSLVLLGVAVLATGVTLVPPGLAAIAQGSGNQGSTGPGGQTGARSTATSTGSPGARGSVNRQVTFPLTAIPAYLTTGPDGALWFTANDQTGEGGTGTVWRMTDSGSPTQVYAAPSMALAAITSGPDGALWFAEGSDTNQTQPVSGIGRLTTGGSFTAYTFSSAQNGAGAITSGPDGALWFTEPAANQIGRITTSGTITEFPVPTPNSFLGGHQPPAGGPSITSGPDGAIWFTEPAANQIGRITTSGTFTEYAIPTANSSPGGITRGHDGALWFTESGPGKIGRITTSGSITEFALPASPASPVDIVGAPDGSLRFALTSGSPQQSGTGNLVGRITTSGTVTEYSPATQTHYIAAVAIVLGPDGNLWIIEAGGQPGGAVTGIHS